jgi:hypothetical protein
MSCPDGEWLRWRQQRKFGAATTPAAAAGHNPKRDIHVNRYAFRDTRGFHKKSSDFADFINVGCEIASNLQPPAQFHLA